MDIHERYLNIRTTDQSVFELLETRFKDDPFVFLHRLIQHYDAEILSNNLDVQKLETFRMILCYEYRLLFASEKKYSRIISHDLCFKRIESVLFLRKELHNPPQFQILYDIILLHMILYCNAQCIEQHFINFQTLNDYLNNNESRNYYMKVMECFLDTLQLRQYLYNDIDLNLLKQLSSLYLQDIIVWLKIKENKEWLSCASIFPKLLHTFGFENVLPVIWEFVLNKMEDIKDILNTLSIIIDILPSVNLKDENLIHTRLYFTEQLWLFIIKSLRSPIQQYRKQALFIMKQVTNFTNVTYKSITKSEKSRTVPFVCNQFIKSELLIKDIKQKFFLVMEALEEKQYHLIAPALTHLPNLIKGNEQHRLCNDCFSNIWLQLIFERMLHHENNTIIKQGILNISKLHVAANDQQFLELFIHALNNTFLYECQSYQEEPELLSHIRSLFKRMTAENAEFMNTFLCIMNKQTWAPIPMFYMMNTLRVVSSQTSNHWKNEEMVLFKSLVQKNLCKHSHVLRNASQIELLRTITSSVGKINNFEIVADTLLDFPSEEALVRSSYSWQIIISWLKTNLTETDAICFVKHICDDYTNIGTHLKLKPAKFALLICMLHDADLILQNKLCPTEETLNNWLSLFNGVDTRPYADITHTFYAIEFISHMLNLSLRGTSKHIVELLCLYINDALKFLLKGMKRILSKLNYEEVDTYLNVTISFLNHGHLLLTTKEIFNYVEMFRNESISILENKKQYKMTYCMYGLYILYYIQDAFNIDPTLFFIQPILRPSDIHISDDSQDNVKYKGKIASDCYLLLAKLTYQYLSNVETHSWPDSVNWFENILYLYERGGTEIVPEIALILNAIVKQGAIKSAEDRLQLESIFDMCWRSTLLSTKNKIYFISIENLIGVIINDNFLVLSNAMNFVTPILEQLFEHSNNVPKLNRILLNKMELLSRQYLKQFQEPLLLCLLHGQVLKRDKQIENQAYLYINKNFINYFSPNVLLIAYNNDASNRALSTTLLHKIINTDTEYASMFLPIVLQRLEKYKNKRYFNDSYVHKMKHRLLQIILILQPNLNKSETARLQELLCKLILLESNQHSVRLMQEWILIRIFIENTELHKNLWKFFEEGIITRPGCVSSIACIVYHVSTNLSNDLQSNFVQTGIKYIARCCLGQNYNMRLYCQVIFVKLYNMLDKFDCNQMKSQYQGLYNAAVESLNDGCLIKNSSKIQDDFYLSIFHPLKDYSLQTIYFDLPRLTGVDSSEWITSNVFLTQKFRKNNDHPLQLCSLNTLLSETKTSPYLVKSTAEIESSVNDSSFEELSDIQKKINPSTSISLICSDTMGMELSNKEGIIIVASLIDRAPNLGGLARTCEIFKAKELVIDNLNQIRDKEFQNLSVSAENWLTITEIKPHYLSKYMLEKKNMGWDLVGVEQTANSTNLLNMQFKKKTVLVLGNEKDGIPANLISLFDTCIEIPQLGLTRSLNVHVSGAICIWQYTQQHMLK